MYYHGVIQVPTILLDIDCNRNKYLSVSTHACRHIVVITGVHVYVLYVHQLLIGLYVFHYDYKCLFSKSVCDRLMCMYIYRACVCIFTVHVHVYLPCMYMYIYRACTCIFTVHVHVYLPCMCMHIYRACACAVCCFLTVNRQLSYKLFD